MTAHSTVRLPYYRCLWCGKYRCHQPLKKCSECEAEYRKMAQTMPRASAQELAKQ
jgi:hypothetical protein